MAHSGSNYFTSNVVKENQYLVFCRRGVQAPAAPDPAPLRVCQAAEPPPPDGEERSLKLFLGRRRRGIRLQAAQSGGQHARRQEVQVQQQQVLFFLLLLLYKPYLFPQSDLTVKLKDGSTRFGHKFVFGARSDQWAKMGDDVAEMGEQLSKTFIPHFVRKAFTYEADRVFS